MPTTREMPATATWACRCGFSNIAHLDCCDLCGAARPAREHTDAGERAAPESARPDDTRWSCRCGFSNVPRLAACDLCGAARPDSEHPAAVAEASTSRSPPAWCEYAWSKLLEDENARVFGGAPLRPLQRRAIDAAMSGRDVLLVMPTGAGKSRSFQLACLLTPGLTVVIAPLLSLMRDQLESAEALAVVVALLLLFSSL